MSSRDWRDSAAYGDLDEMSLRGLAWEYLRRNPDYLADYLEFRSAGGADRSSDVAQSWGLRFRGRSFAPRDGHSGVLGISFDIGPDNGTVTRALFREDDAAPQLAIGSG